MKTRLALGTALWAIALLATLSFPSHVLAATPIAFQARPGDTLVTIANFHQVSVSEMMEVNPGISPSAKLTPGQWITLPEDARLPRQPVVAIEASSDWRYELKYIYAQTKVKAVYAITGRQFAFGQYAGRWVVLTPAGGGVTNAAIGTELAVEHFNVAAVGFVGIAGIGHGGRVGDTCVAAAAVQADQGNWYDFSYPEGDVQPGLAWYMGGQPIISATGKTSQLVLVQDASLRKQILKSLNSVTLPTVGQDVADYMTFMTGQTVERYNPQVLTDCWSASGNQFVTSDGWLRLTEQRSQQAAAQVGIPAPSVSVVDEEDFGAIMTAVEFDKPWFVVRVGVDLARQKDPATGVPFDLILQPDEVFGWLFTNEQITFISSYDDMYRNIGLVTQPIIAGMSLPAEPQRVVPKPHMELAPSWLKRQ